MNEKNRLTAEIPKLAEMGNARIRQDIQTMHDIPEDAARQREGVVEVKIPTATEIIAELEEAQAEVVRLKKSFDDIGKVLYPMHGAEHYGDTPEQKFCYIADICQAAHGEDWTVILQRARASNE